MKQSRSAMYLAQALEHEAAGNLEAARIPAIKSRNLASNPEDYARAKVAFARIVEGVSTNTKELQVFETL